MCGEALQTDLSTFASLTSWWLAGKAKEDAQKAKRKSKEQTKDKSSSVASKPADLNQVVPNVISSSINSVDQGLFRGFVSKDMILQTFAFVRAA